MSLVSLPSIRTKYILLDVQNRSYSCLPITTEDRRKIMSARKAMSICPNLPTAAGRRGSRQGSFILRKRALTPMAMDYLNPNSANFTYSIREHSVCVDERDIWPYTSLGRKGIVSIFSLPSLQ